MHLTWQQTSITCPQQSLCGIIRTDTKWPLIHTLPVLPSVFFARLEEPKKEKGGGEGKERSGGAFFRPLHSIFFSNTGVRSLQDQQILKDE